MIMKEYFLYQEVFQIFSCPLLSLLIILSTMTIFMDKHFLNYLTQLLPGPVNRYFDFENSVYFESSGVFDEYSWNGGINVISIFTQILGILA